MNRQILALARALERYWTWKRRQLEWREQQRIARFKKRYERERRD